MNQPDPLRAGITIGTTAVLFLTPIASEGLTLQTHQVGSYRRYTRMRALAATDTPTILNKPSVSTADIPSNPEVVRVLTAIRELHELQDGWLTYTSKAPDRHVLELLEENASRLVGGKYSLVPASDGSVAVVWQRGDDEMTAEFKPDGTLYLFVDHTQDDDFEESSAPYSADRLDAFLETGVV